ncbi:hypothetical protein [Dysosmobacter sp.]|uniref:hypothetical protein n=1 Tax=Dysosmobacter sp. TaxID=2591382 RepID=UPI002DB6511D|nr:hypothetical protein [Dysosmobacter sp.]
MIAFIDDFNSFIYGLAVGGGPLGDTFVPIQSGLSSISAKKGNVNCFYEKKWKYEKEGILLAGSRANVIKSRRYHLGKTPGLLSIIVYFCQKPPKMGEAVL